MSDTQIMLLRGINVGRAKRVAMAELRALLAELGYENVRTLLNSGNMVLSEGAGETAARIEEALAERLGVSARVTVLTAAELTAIVQENPLLDRADTPSRLQCAFLFDPADRARLVSLLERRWEPEAFALGARVAYLWCPNGLSKSGLHKAIRDILDDRVTTRTWNTVLKLHALAAS